jgi:hypothetical protein
LTMLIKLHKQHEVQFLEKNYWFLEVSLETFISRVNTGNKKVNSSLEYGGGGMKSMQWKHHGSLSHK